MNATAEQVKVSVQYLTFSLDEQWFGVEVSKVNGILEVTQITKVPKTPDYMRGVINLRGSPVPAIDLRLKFGMSQIEQTVDTCIVVLEVPLDDETVVLGAIVDSVDEVIELKAEQIEPAPRLGTGQDSEFIEAMGKRDDRFIILLNIAQVFSTEELTVVQAAGEKTADNGRPAQESQTDGD